MIASVEYLHSTLVPLILPSSLLDRVFPFHLHSTLVPLIRHLLPPNILSICFIYILL